MFELYLLLYPRTNMNQISQKKFGCQRVKGIKLASFVRRGEKHHLFVSDKSDFAAVRNEVAYTLQEFLCRRFSVDEIVTSQLVSFVQFQTTADLHAVHKAIAADLDVRNLMLEYEELASERELVAKPPTELVKCLCRSEEYPTVLTVLSRVLAAKPHSADVE